MGNQQPTNCFRRSNERSSRYSANEDEDVYEDNIYEDPYNPYDAYGGRSMDYNNLPLGPIQPDKSR